MKIEDVKALYAVESGERKKPAAEAFQALRTEVHGVLQREQPVPKGEVGEDPDDVHHKQKQYGKKLWLQTEKLIADAGITAEGMKV